MNNACRLFAVIAVTGLATLHAAEPSTGAADDKKAAEPSLDIQYAQARLALAEANLKRVEARNKKVANAVSPNVIAEYRGDVEVAKVAFDDATKGETDTFAVWLQGVEAQWKSANTTWKSAVAANKRKQGTVNELDVERLRLRAEMLKINLERGQALTDQPREAQLQWRLSVLDDEVERLTEVVFRTSPARGSSPTVWYYYVPW